MIGIAPQDVGGVIEVEFKFALVIQRAGRTIIGTSRVCGPARKRWRLTDVFGFAKFISGTAPSWSRRATTRQTELEVRIGASRFATIKNGNLVRQLN